ncbi:MAG: hypothetical protein GX447_02530 [Elusimicrobia bacterium]|nr:hypothetical protein [Elusimicrobiota bacterium]
MEKKIKKNIKSRLNIWLCGFSFSGKSSAGKILARLTGKRFIDTDTLVRKKTGFSPANLIKENKEKLLRKTEKKILKELSDKKGLIVSLGGGISPKDLPAQKYGGICVFLNRSFKEIEKELLLSDNSRPLLSGKTFKERKNKAKKLYLKRIKYYLKADLKINFKNLKPYGLAVKIKKALNEI